MPRSRFRTSRARDTGLRRYSTLDPPQSSDLLQQRLSEDGNHLGLEGFDSIKSSSPLRHSFEPSTSDDGPSSSVWVPAVPEPNSKRTRFSVLKYRNASDPQISRTARDQASSVPPMPTAPSIITTAPTESLVAIQEKASSFAMPGAPRTWESAKSPSQQPSHHILPNTSSNPMRNTVGHTSANISARALGITFDEPDTQRGSHAPPPYGDDLNSALALPVSRMSESSRSEGSSGEHGVYATTTTTHTVSTTTTFFRLPRRKKNKGPLFPLPVKTQSIDPLPNAIDTVHASSGAYSAGSQGLQSPTKSPSLVAIPHPPQVGDEDIHRPNLASPAPAPVHFGRKDSNTFEPSESASPVPGGPMLLGRRGRSSTKGSRRQSTDDEPLPTPPLAQSTRTSSSTIGRASLGGLFTLSRLRQNSEPQQFRHGLVHPPLPNTPISAGSKAPSFSLSREPLVVPERKEGDTPAKYLIRLEEAVSRGVVATILSQSNDEFFKNVLRSYMRGFKFFGDPLDMSTRKLLMEVELPKETQQIDRVLQAFANRYHECNPGVYASPDEAYFIAFSILILHTDVFNKNNKHKMQKEDYTRNAQGQGVADEILECFYDNISYTPFIHVEDDLGLNGERVVARKTKKSMFTKPGTDSSGKPSREPVDPYTLILDDRLDSLRPSLKDVMNLDDHYNYLGTAPCLNLANLHKTFFKSGILQIVSSRSRPDAFMSPETMKNPAEAHPGVVDIKITKVGILWRKDMKKKKARSPWQEWGAILTGAQLYFFRNTTWVKSLVHQHDSHHKHGYVRAPVIFKPPLEQFKPDVLMSTENAVALLDTTYKKHKHALVFVRHGGFEETFLADSEVDMNDWLAKLNYAATFRTAGVRMRGLLAGINEGARTRAMRRMSSSTSALSEQTAANEVTVESGNSETELAYQIQAARRQIMTQKIAEADAKLSDASKQLEAQLRNARHLQILAPIQNKTREQVILAAGRMAAKIKWMRMEMWRTRCYRDILSLDLEEDINLSGDCNPQTQIASNCAGPAVSLSDKIVKKIESHEGYLASQSYCTDNTIRPSTQPSPGKSLSMDNVFQAMQVSPPASKRTKDSWEIPPLSFQPSRSSLQAGSSLEPSLHVKNSFLPQPSSRSLSDTTRISQPSDMASQLAKPTPAIDNNEREVLKEAGLIEQNSPAPKTKHPETPSESRDRSQDKGIILESEVTDGKSKVRRSLHRTLRDSHTPSHHKSRKGKESSGGVSLADDNSAIGDGEGLTRGSGSFTVHGKKASVITFGSEWQNMSPEERLSLRRQAQNEESKLAVPAAVEDDDSSVKDAFDKTIRPVSVISASTATTKSIPFEETIGDFSESAASHGQTSTIALSVT